MTCINMIEEIFLIKKYKCFYCLLWLLCVQQQYYISKSFIFSSWSLYLFFLHLMNPQWQKILLLM